MCKRHHGGRQPSRRWASRSRKPGESWGSRSSTGTACNLELVPWEQSHWLLLARCTEELHEELLRFLEETRDRTVRILEQVWRLLPSYRLRQIWVSFHLLPGRRKGKRQGWQLDPALPRLQGERVQQLVLGLAGPNPSPVQCVWHEVARGAASTQPTATKTNRSHERLWA